MLEVKPSRPVTLQRLSVEGRAGDRVGEFGLPGGDEVGEGGEEGTDVGEEGEEGSCRERKG
jgi:hypothetical protein